MVGAWEQMHRREVLRLAALGVAVGRASRRCSGCSSGSDAAPRRPPAPPTTVPFDPDVPWWLQGGFAPVTDEVESHHLEVEGALPPELTGLYVRNGSNPRTGVSPHWFLGDGMVHGIRLEDGQAISYRNRYVRTPLYEASAGFGEGVPGGEASQSNVSAIWHGGKLLTSARSGYPYELSPRRPQHDGRLRLRRPADHVDDRPPEDRPGHRPDALLRLRLRAAVPHVPRGRRGRDARSRAPRCRCPGRR